MAYIENGKYGIASNQEEKSRLLRKKGIEEVAWKNQFQNLRRRLYTGDSIYVVSVSSFIYSACDFWRKMQIMEDEGISFISEQEQYLNWSRECPLSSATKDILYRLAEREVRIMQDINSCKGLDYKMKNYLCDRLCMADVFTIQDIFKNGGIKKRGN